MATDRRVAEALDVLVPEASQDGDWSKVVRDAGTPLGQRQRPDPRRRRAAWAALGVALLVLAALAATPATGLRSAFTSLFSKGETAPEDVQREFQSLDQGAPAGMAPGVKGKARRVATFQLSTGAVALFVAPAANGGYCKSFNDRFGGCRTRGIPLGVTFMTDGRNVELLGGDILRETGARSVEARFADGRRETLDVVWVSPPIEAGFFLYEIPASERGHELIEVVALDDDGNEVAREDVP